MAQRCGAITENIAVLSLFATTFEPITEYPIPTRKTAEDDHRRLSLKQEQELAEAFAVLLANDDNPSTVGAVCVEEQKGTPGIVIRTAVNTGDQKQRIAEFDRIAKALMRCSIGL